jgi:hypothetical protein
MTKDDEKEMRRLSEKLRAVHEKVGDDTFASEAVKKAALAISLGFIHGLRPEIEKHYLALDRPLTKRQRTHIAKLHTRAHEKKKA